jgi:hypothetical protein
VTDFEYGIAPMFPNAGPIPINSTSPIIPAILAAITTQITKTKRIQVQIIPTNDGSLYPIPKMPSGCP